MPPPAGGPQHPRTTSATSAGSPSPPCVVNGSTNIVIPTINSYHLYQHLPDAELMLLPDSGHGAHFQYVERFVRRVIDFLDVQPHDTATPA